MGQNRQFHWLLEPTYTYPMVPASAATLLHNAKHEVIWDDGIAEQRTYDAWLKDVSIASPDMIVMETKTPVVKKHWLVIEDIKTIDSNIAVVLVGDHVTALPRESMENSKVDYILTGGDYDFLALNLVEHLEHNENLEPGVWFRSHKKIRSTGKFELRHNLDELPFVDRELTKWWLYSETSSNYKKLPGTYTMVGRDCWHHGCKFCSWPTLYPVFRVRKPESLLDEIGVLVNKYPIKEIMDDTGTFPVGSWLRKFCLGMIKRGYNKDVIMDCNMRFGALSYEDYRLMKRAGFRMLLFGLESGNQETLDRLNKKITIEQIVDSCKKAKSAGLEPHLTVMFGYPWEKKEHAQKTLELSEFLLKKGYAYTIQATLVVPYPGTPMFEEARKNRQIKTTDWDHYDMSEPVMKTLIEDEEIMEMIQKVYAIALDPEFITRRIMSIRNIDDIRFMFRAARKVFGQLGYWKSVPRDDFEECA